MLIKMLNINAISLSKSIFMKQIYKKMKNNLKK
jgi:hypothetical protein